ncbi:hypothetical protein Clacol_004942 [Clathrus columnatus]|uniref:F-box domain-containing protein n=1 Tax=Clathrus columnatus TaxID=1419009 RepID=A0AAV5ACS5_9AGAM|nr:hypothetical protein Clacol_004942 [Clathrus columnatus]
MPRLQEDTALLASFPYRRNTRIIEPHAWCYELFTRAVLQMTHLKVFFWERLESPVLPTRGELWKDFVLKHKQHKLDRTFSMDKVLEKSPRPSYVSFFDIPLNDSHKVRSLEFWRVVSVSVKTVPRTRGDHFLIKGLITFCRLPKLRVLSVNLYRDKSPPPSQAAIMEFFGYHTSLIRVKWFVSLRSGTRLEVDFPPDSLPRLEQVEADPHFTTLLLSTPCDPPRPIRKIIRFPLNTQLWVDPSFSLQGIDTSCLRTVSFKRISALVDISHFTSFFVNVECLDVSHSDIPTGIWDALLREYHIPPQVLTRWLNSLDRLTKLKYLRGMQFFTELDQPDVIQRRLEMIMRVFPHLEFFSDPSSAVDAIQITRDGESIGWKAAELRQWDSYFGIEGDSTV